jgi:hypothetical protein
MQPETLGLLVDILDATRFIAEDTVDTTCHEFQFDRRMRQAVLYNFMTTAKQLTACDAKILNSQIESRPSSKSSACGTL